jgi:hypothetical protein
LHCNCGDYSQSGLTLAPIFCQIKTIHNNIFSEMITHLVRRRPEYATLALKVWCSFDLNIKLYYSSAAFAPH